MAYDPFARGPHPAGVRSGLLIDPRREGRRLPLDVWYPAAPHYAGQDLLPASQDTFETAPGGPALQQSAVRDAAGQQGSFPLIAYSHASGGHRRASTFLCTHLASHGYVVAAVDHTGNTAVDMAEVIQRIAAGETLPAAERDQRVERIVSARVPDLRFLLDEILSDGAGDVTTLVDPSRVGLLGWSIGGWAVLATLEVDTRAAAVVGLAPAGSRTPVPGVIPAQLTLTWQREVPALLLAGELDPWTPRDGIRDIYERVTSAKRMFTLAGAAHGHFGDVIEDEGACTTEHAQAFTRSLTLAHFDAALKGNEEASRFLESAAGELKARGVSVARD